MQDKIKWFNSDMTDTYKETELASFIAGETWGYATTESFGMVSCTFGNEKCMMSSHVAGNGCPRYLARHPMVRDLQACDTVAEIRACGMK